MLETATTIITVIVFFALVGCAGQSEEISEDGGASDSDSDQGDTDTYVIPDPHIEDYEGFDTDPPGGLTADQVPQFVVIGNDDNAFTGTDGKGGIRFLLGLLEGKTNPAGNGNPATFDGAPVHFTMYNISDYIYTPTQDSVSDVKLVWREAYDAGNEVGNHTDKHPDCAFFDAAQWEQEISVCNSWLTKPYDADDLDSKEVGLGVPPEEIIGFRTPYLRYNDRLFPVLTALGFKYDCSIVEGLVKEHDGTNYAWPYELDRGSPANSLIGPHPGLWEIPVYAFVVPPDEACAAYGVAEGLRAALAARNPQFDPASGKIRGLDYDLWMDYDMTRTEFAATIKYSFDLHLNGNRAPFTLGIHTDVYHPESWDDAEFGGADADERKAALTEVLAYFMEVPQARLVSVKELLTWLENPVAL